jgi:hypothetical protein
LPKLEAAAKFIPEWTDYDNQVKALEEELKSPQVVVQKDHHDQEQKVDL